MSYRALWPPSRPPLEEFDTMYLKTKATEFRDGSASRSTVINMPIGEFLTVHDERNVRVVTVQGRRQMVNWFDILRFITFYKATTKDVSQHPVSVSSLRMWMEELSMHDPDCQHVRMRIVFFVDWCENTRHGVKFVETVDEVYFEYDINYPYSRTLN